MLVQYCNGVANNQSGLQMSGEAVAEYDLFISYAHVDNVPLVKDGIGWVSALKQRLDQHLSQKLGRPEACRIWFDNTDLHGNHEVRSHIPAEVGRSKLFLAVLSPGYVASDWCQNELKAFTERHAGDLAGRIFPISRAPLRQDQGVPQSVQGPRGYQFWINDANKRPRTYAVPDVGPDDREYWRLIDDIAEDIASALPERHVEKLHSGHVTLVPPPTAKPGGLIALPGLQNHPVPLAEVPEDMQPRRDDVRRFLQQAGIPILPQGVYPPTFGTFRDALSADLAQAALFVQLLGEIPDDGRTALQFEEARRNGLPMIHWRSPDVLLERVASPVWRALLEYRSVQAVPIEDFKQAVINELSRLLTPPPPPPAAPLLLINANPVDLPQAQVLQDALGDAVEFGGLGAPPRRSGPAK